MDYCFDLDGTLCSDTNGEYENATPKWDRIERVNELYDEGNHITIDTARGSATGIDWYKVTLDQLSIWNVKYHKLVVGKKTPADFYIDDKAENADNFFS